MVIAQRLYEGIELGTEAVLLGLITYMRTDSTRVAGHRNPACRSARLHQRKDIGAAYLPASPTVYKTKKDAQDAHEAIRPTSVAYTPDSVAKFLSEDELKLYRLIWQRFVASQMVPAVFDQTSIDILAGDNLFRATGSVMKFDGFLKVYEESKETSDDEDEERKHTLPPVTEGETLKMTALKLSGQQHFHRAAAAFQRSHAGERAGREGHRASIDVCQHPERDSGSRVRGEADEPLLPGPSFRHRSEQPARRKKFLPTSSISPTPRGWKKSSTKSKKASSNGLPR